MNQPTGTAVRIGVIGCGAIAELYHLPALKACPRTTAGLVLVEPNATRLRELGQRFNVATLISDYRDLIGKVDGVIVATPPASHYSISKWAIEQGLHVLCEKPLTENISEARQLVELASQHRVCLAVNQTRRLFPTYQKIRELISRGILGNLQSITYHDGVEFDWPAASPHHFKFGAKGAWSDTGVHLLDSICFWLDAKPQFVRAWNDSFGGPEAMATSCFRYKDCDIEIKVSRLGRLMNGFRIVGSLGTIEAEAEDWDEFTIQFVNGSSQRFQCGSNRWKYTDFAKPLIENFAEVVAGEAKPIVSGGSTLATIELLEAAYEHTKIYPMPWNRSWVHSSRTSAFEKFAQQRVLVTGAAGFVGGRVVESMLLSGCSTPIAAIRSWARAARVATHAVEVAICDILNSEQVDQAVRGVDAIVHCAYGNNQESIVAGTRNLLDAAIKHKIKSFVYLSSAEAYGPDLAGEVTESATVNPTGRAYGDAKLAAEELCRSYQSKGLSATILRPSLIYGPYGTSWSIDVAARLRSGKWRLFDGFGDGIANLVHVDDLVQAILLSLNNPAARGETFNVNGPERPTWNQYFAKFNAALELPPLQHISPTSSRLRTLAMDSVGRVTTLAKSLFEDRLMEIYLRGGVASRWMKRLKNALHSTPSSSELTNLYSRQANYDDTKIKRLLGYAPTYDLDAGIAELLPWLELHELIPHEQQSTIEGTAVNDREMRVPVLPGANVE